MIGDSYVEFIGNHGFINLQCHPRKDMYTWFQSHFFYLSNIDQIFNMKLSWGWKMTRKWPDLIHVITSPPTFFGLPSITYPLLKGIDLQCTFFSFFEFGSVSLDKELEGRLLKVLANWLTCLSKALMDVLCLCIKASIFYLYWSKRYYVVGFFSISCGLGFWWKPGGAFRMNKNFGLALLYKFDMFITTNWSYIDVTRFGLLIFFLSSVVFYW